MSAFDNATLMITGGTGSFGSTVLKHFLDSDLKEIRIFSRDEKKQDDMRHELQAKHPENAKKVKFYIGDVRNPQSIRDAMPMAILDAMGCGLPIVSTDVGGIPKIVRQGINGYLYKPGDSKSMACAIIEYLTDDEKRLKAGQESVDIIRESYSLQQNIDKLERVYTEVERLRDDKL